VDVKREPEPARPNPVVDRLAREGKVRPARYDLRDVLERRGPLTGDVTDAGTRAVQEQRGERA
jgi:hypothetical protein